MFSEAPNMSEPNVDNSPQMAPMPGGPPPAGAPIAASGTPIMIPGPRPPGNGTRPMLNNGGSGWPGNPQSTGGNGSAPYKGPIPPKGANKRDPRKR